MSTTHLSKTPPLESKQEQKAVRASVLQSGCQLPVSYLKYLNAHLDIVDLFKQITTVIAHREVKGAVEATLLLTQEAHLMVP